MEKGADQKILGPLRISRNGMAGNIPVFGARSCKKKLDNRGNAGTLQACIGEKSLITPRCQEPTWRVTPFSDVNTRIFLSYVEEIRN